MSWTYHMVAMSSRCFSCIKMFMAFARATWNLSVPFSVPQKDNLEVFQHKLQWQFESCHSPVAKAAETWSRIVLTCPTPINPWLPSMPTSHRCIAQIFQSPGGSFAGKAAPWSKKAEPLGTRLRGSRFTRNYTQKPSARDGRCTGTKQSEVGSRTTNL